MLVAKISVRLLKKINLDNCKKYSKIPDMKKFKVLIVDDNPKNIQYIGNILQAADYSIGFATSGRQAIDLLNKTMNYDILLLDINMPEMDGFETCIEIRKDEKHKDLPIIFLTAYNESDEIVKGFSAGAHDYITKPFKPEELLARINTQLIIKQKNEQLIHYAQNLEKSNATKVKFISIIAHDLKNPLAGLITNFRLLTKNFDKYETEDIKETIKIMFDATIHLNNLLENLLLWSKSQADKIVFSVTSINLFNLVEKCVNVIDAHAKIKKINIQNNIGKNINIVADIYQLEAIIRNLLSNAIKYTNENGKVTISAKNSNDKTTVIVTDSGIGMSKEVKSKLFNSGATICSLPGTREEPGTGLGLLITKEFVNNHNGEIYCESEEGIGSKFIFTIGTKTIDN